MDAECFGPDAILERLDPEQREVAATLRGPMVVLAGAGTGKTRAITHRIAYGVRSGVYRASSVLAVTFTARAAGEMRLRLRDLGAPGVNAKTFHAAALKQLRYFWPQAIGGQMGEIIEHKGRYIGEAARHVGLKVDSISIRDLAKEIEWAKVTMLEPERYVTNAVKLGREPITGFTFEEVAALALGYERLKEARGLIDFEDILTILGGILAENSSITEMVRNQYRHFVVDEYQDVSPLQQYLLDQWLGDSSNLCVVGDPSQTIYSFTGATPDYLLNFRRRFPQAQEVRLIRNYRSTPQVVRLANGVLAQGKVAGALTLQAQQAAGAEPVFEIYPDDDAEAQAVAARCVDLIANGVQASEIAVLYRTNAQSQAFEQALSQVGVGFQLKGSVQFFNRAEVRQAVSLLATHRLDPAAGEAFAATVRSLLSGIGWAAEPPAPSGAMRERWDSMCALVALADQLVAESARSGVGLVANMEALLSELRERASHQHAPSIDGVTLASLHSAKGLEWDAVFLVGMSEGLMPISLADTPELVAEERRLLYVGVTRARKRLEVSFARGKVGGRATRKPTRFLDGNWPQPAGGGADRGGKAPKAARAAKANAISALDPGELAMFERLRSWRSGEAKASQRAAFTVLPDATLISLAQRRPASLPALAKVPGIGPVKIEQYGEPLLELLREAA